MTSSNPSPAAPGPTDVLLRLEFACTPAERSEASSLLLRQQIGGGSKWRTMAILLLVLAALGWVFWLAILRNASRAEGALWIGIFLTIWIITFVRLRSQKRRGAGTPVVVEIAAQGVRLSDTQSWGFMPWSAFSRRVESDTLLLLQQPPGPASFALILPKRVIPSPEWLEWLRAATDHATAALSPAPTVITRPVAPAEAAVTAAPCRAGYLDFLDFTLASWLGRGIVIAWIVMWVGITLYSASKPHPHAVYTDRQVFLCFVLPFMFIGGALLTLFFAGHSWLLHARTLRDQSVAFTEEHLTVSSPRGTFAIPWSTYACYKETPRALLIWTRRSRSWLIIPKRGFASADALQHARTLLARHLRRSPWFAAH